MLSTSIVAKDLICGTRLARMLYVVGWLGGMQSRLSHHNLNGLNSQIPGGNDRGRKGADEFNK
jgi:hypothetical protein